MTLPDDVIAVLSADPRITAVELTGSRARGQETPLSDWDFAVTAAEFDAVRDALPDTVRPGRASGPGRTPSPGRRPGSLTVTSC
jgi:hypothetical protein